MNKSVVQRIRILVYAYATDKLNTLKLPSQLRWRFRFWSAQKQTAGEEGCGHLISLVFSPLFPQNLMPLCKLYFPFRGGGVVAWLRVIVSLKLNLLLQFGNRFLVYDVDNRIPSDHTRKTTDVSDIPAYLFIVFSATASLGIVLGVIFLVFNRYYRKCR